VRNAEPYLISHRGAAGLAPENTLAGIRESVRHGAKFIEVDVQRSADGLLVLMHDLTVDRTTNGTGPVSDLTWDAISALDAGTHFSPEFAGEPVPALDAALALAIRQNVTLLLEIKYPGQKPGIETQLAEAIEGAGAQDHTVVISFEHDFLQRFNRVAPHIPVSPIWYRPGPDPQIPNTRSVNVHWATIFLRPTFIRQTHRRGHHVVTWTVNDVPLMKLLLRLGVDGIVTDLPNLWAKI
jgi:glycerophosphoryl diester phosphodiesterase